MLNKIKGYAVAAAASTPLVMIASQAHATGLTAPTVDLTDFYTIATVVLGAIVSIWMVQKAIGMFRGK